MTDIKTIQQEVGGHPPLLVRTLTDVGIVPANIQLQVNHDVALAMINRKYAEPVGNFAAFADFWLYDYQIEEAGLGFLAMDRECR